MATDVIVPALGESISEATLGEWLKQPGDAVALDEPVASLETDKVSVEVPSPVAGTFEEQLVGVGETVAVGAVIARVGDAAPAGTGTVSAAPASAGTAVAAAPAGDGAPAGDAAPGVVNPAGPAEQMALKGDATAPHADKAGSANDAALTLSPAVRRAVLEAHLDPSKIKGSGKDGRLTKEDVIEAARAQPAPTPATPPQPAPTPATPPQPAPTPASASPTAGQSAPAPASAAPAAPAAAVEKAVAAGLAQAAAAGRREERVPMSRLRKTIAARLKEAQNTAALLTTFNDVDMSAVIEARERYRDLFEKKHGVRLGFMGFFVKAVALALRDVPSVNASLEGEEIVYRDYLDVSVAVSAPKGLVVPVVRDADKLGFAEIEKAIAAFGKKAKDGTLTIDEMKGGTFTISNGGVFGSLLSTPIINPPQSAVLGMHRIEDRPVVRGGEVVVRPMMYLALSYDHRLIDGREAVTFLVQVKEAIEDPTRLLIDL